MIDPNHPLKDGVVGREIVAYFEPFGKVPVDAELLAYGVGNDVTTYRLTFEDGTTSDYKITFDSRSWFKVLSATLA